MEEMQTVPMSIPDLDETREKIAANRTFMKPLAAAKKVGCHC